MRGLSIPPYLKTHTALLHPFIFSPRRVHHHPPTPQPTCLRHALFQPHHLIGPLHLRSLPLDRGYGKVLQNLRVGTDFKFPRRGNDVSRRWRWRVVVPIEDRSWRRGLRGGQVVRVRYSVPDVCFANLGADIMGREAQGRSVRS